MKRRDFLQTTIATGLSVASVNLIPPEVRAEPFPKDPFSTDPAAKIHLTPNIVTSRIGMGTGVHGGGRQCNLTRMERDRAIRIIQFCYDNGIRFFDMADMYGSHGLVAEALAGKPRDSYVLSTKIWCRPGGLPEPERLPADQLIERFLKELRTDYVDMIQIHCLTDDQWETKYAYQFEPLQRLKEKGLIRAHGVSCHSLAAAKLAAVNPWVDAMHIRLNHLGMNMDGSWDENVAVTQTAKQNGKGIIIMKILGEGKMHDPEHRKTSTDAVVRLPSKDVMIVGFEKEEHVTEFLENVGASLKAMEAEQVNS